jgi:hypothetical protein
MSDMMPTCNDGAASGMRQYQCAGRLCFKMSWDEWSHFCNEECRIHVECDMFFSTIIGYLHPNKLP